LNDPYYQISYDALNICSILIHSMFSIITPALAFGSAAERTSVKLKFRIY